jgi:hypothetical protein
VPLRLFYKPNATYQEIIKANYNLKSVEMLYGEFSTEIYKNSTIILSLNVNKSNFFYRSYEGSLKVTDIYERNAYLSNIAIDTYNPAYVIFFIINGKQYGVPVIPVIFGLLILFLIWYLFFHKKILSVQYGLNKRIRKKEKGYG